MGEQKILKCHAAFKPSETDTGDYIFAFSEVFFQQNGNIYHTTIKQRLSLDGPFPHFDLDDESVSLIPPDATSAAWPDGATVYKPLPGGSIPDDVHVKVPNLFGYDPTNPPDMAEYYHPEVRILEIIKADRETQHDPRSVRIVDYYGCLQSSDGLQITGICLKKYPFNLTSVCYDHNAGKDSGLPITVLASKAKTIFKGIIEGIQYLHSLGIIHCDINPSNIMLDDDLNPILIDFGISVYRGDKLQGGTMDWEETPERFLKPADDDIDIRNVYRLVIFLHGYFKLENLELPVGYDGSSDDFNLCKLWLIREIRGAEAWLRVTSAERC